MTKEQKAVEGHQWVFNKVGKSLARKQTSYQEAHPICTGQEAKSHRLVKSSMTKKKHKADFEERVIVVHTTNKHI